MNKNFWKKLKKPIMVLAPMEGVTDAAFRFLIAKHEKPDVMFTEFTAADALCSRGKKNALINLRYDSIERPIVAQIFGKQSKNFYKAAKMIVELGFDGIDINMGCPEKNIIKSGAGAALMKTPELACEIIRATKEGAGGLPVSVKTRIGFQKNEVSSWIPALLQEEPAALIIHGRTKKEMSKVPNHWDAIAKARKIRDGLKVKTLILGNGDVKSIREAREIAKKYKLDGIMLGRAVFGNPWLFNARKKKITTEERLGALLEHTVLFQKYFQNIKNFEMMKKHYKAYVSGWDGAKALRVQLMKTKNALEVELCIQKYISSVSENIPQ